MEKEAGDLAEGVDAGVGASGALREDGFPGDVADGFGESALDGWERRLDLPAVEGGAVVGEGELPVLGLGRGLRLGVQSGSGVWLEGVPI